jgi:hypothetical protein
MDASPVLIPTIVIASRARLRSTLGTPLGSLLIQGDFFND